MANLTSQQIKDSYQSLITTSETTTNPTTGTLQNGKGTPMTALTLGGNLTATQFIGGGGGLTALDLPTVRVRWTSGFFNLTNASWNTIRFNDLEFNSSGGYGSVYAFENNGTVDASIRIDEPGLYAVITEAHFYDLTGDVDLRVGVFASTTSATAGFSLVRAVSDVRINETSTDQMITGVSVFNWQTVPIWVKMSVQPSANTPYPSDTDSAPNAMTIIRIGQ